MSLLASAPGQQTHSYLTSELSIHLPSSGLACDRLSSHHSILYSHFYPPEANVGQTLVTGSYTWRIATRKYYTASQCAENFSSVSYYETMKPTVLMYTHICSQLLCRHGFIAGISFICSHSYIHIARLLTVGIRGSKNLWCRNNQEARWQSRTQNQSIAP